MVRVSHGQAEFGEFWVARAYSQAFAILGLGFQMEAHFFPLEMDHFLGFDLASPTWGQFDQTGQDRICFFAPQKHRASATGQVPYCGPFGRPSHFSDVTRLPTRFASTEPLLSRKKFQEDPLGAIQGIGP